MKRTRSYLVPTLRDVTYDTMMRLVHVDVRMVAWWASLDLVKPRFGDTLRTWTRVKWVIRHKRESISMAYAGLIGDETLISALGGANHSRTMAAFYACRAGYEGLAERIVRSAPSSVYDAWMAAACEGGHRAIVERMIVLGATSWNWSLRNACYGGHLELVEFMLEHEATDLEGCLAMACRGGHVDIVDRMLALGAINYNRALRAAAYSGQYAFVERMLALGADQLDSALVDAYDGNHCEVAVLLIAKGAKTQNFMCSGWPDSATQRP